MLRDTDGRVSQQSSRDDQLQEPLPPPQTMTTVNGRYLDAEVIVTVRSSVTFPLVLPNLILRAAPVKKYKI